ncbi:MAG: hypothetical protein K5895_08930 [Lachnospiraceae bacterium]|nr:hypothetical protein [Lachnospiraceae bacterium]
MVLGAMGIGKLLEMTAVYMVKYVVYIGVIICAVLAGKAWGNKAKKAKVEKDNQV